ncbi:MAG: high-affinity iron transporter [Pseudonocardiales bacterium]|nr:high-affinity iron transporter [Pseudonocardiales bacterium]
MRRLLLVLAGFAALVGVLAAPMLTGTAVAAPAGRAVSTTAVPTSDAKAAAIRQLDVVRASIDQTLALIKAGRAEQAFAVAKDGYLSHFEYVEIPLRVIDPGFTADVETQFAVIRNAISDGDPVDSIRDEIVTLRAMIDSVERRLTALGVGGPLVVAAQSFLIIFREGLEAVLLISILLGYLASAKASQFRRPILLGMGAAAAASVVTFFALRSLLSALPLGRELLEAITALLAVAVLFYVSFWLVARLEQKRWLEFLRARVWKAVSVGSTTALVLVGFTAVYREGFETALFYQALASFGPGLGWWILAGLAAGIVVLTGCAWAILRLGRKLPVKRFLTVAVTLLMFTSVTILGNAVRALQEADAIPLHRWADWPRAQIFVAQSLGYWPSRETILAQGALTLVYLAGAFWVFVVRPRRARAVPAVSGRKDPAPVDTAGEGATEKADATS